MIDLFIQDAFWKGSRNFLEEVAPVDCPSLSGGTSPVILTLTLRAQSYHGDIVAGVAAGKILWCVYKIQGSIRNTAAARVASLYDFRRSRGKRSPCTGEDRAALLRV